MTQKNTRYFQNFKREWIFDAWPSFQAHKDGITYIEVIHEYGVYCTSSFDCCVHLYSFDGPDQKIGRLILGTNLDWGLKLNVRKRRKGKYEKAYKLLSEVKKTSYEQRFQQEEKKEEEILIKSNKELKRKIEEAEKLEKRDTVLRKAREMLIFSRQYKDLGTKFSGQGLIEDKAELSMGEDDFVDELIQELGGGKFKKKKGY